MYPEHNHSISETVHNMITSKHYCYYLLWSMSCRSMGAESSEDVFQKNPMAAERQEDGANQRNKFEKRGVQASQ